MEEERPIPTSLFVVVYSFKHRQLSILQVKRPEKDQVKKKTSMDEVKVVRFIAPEEMIRWYVSPPTTTTSTDELYILPSCHSPPPLHSYQFNFITGSLQKIKPPISHKYDGFVANLGPHHYYISTLNYGYDNVDFECYDPAQNSWKALKPFPKGKFGFQIVATVVCDDDTILFNVDHRVICAYNVALDKWYPVHVNVGDMACYSIVGNAVVVQGTIYALANLENFRFNRVLALSIKIGERNGDLVYTCSLHSEISVAGMETILDHERVWTPTRDLLHLGKRNFCLVQTCMVEGSRENLYLRLTYMELTGENLAILTESYHKLKIQDRDDFEVVQCFFLPECKATAFQGGKRLDFEVDPHEVHSVYVKNLPHYATVEQVDKGLNVFGPIVRDGILIRKKNKKKVFAFVEFESAASKQRAIEAKTVSIEDCRAEIYDRQGNINKNQPHSSGLQKDVQAQ